MEMIAAPSLQGGYEQVEAGRLPETTKARDNGQQRPRPTLALLWGASLLGTFCLGLFVAPHVASSGASASTTSSLDGIVDLAIDRAPPSLYDVYNSKLKPARYIDLTHAFSPEIPTWSGFGPEEVWGGMCKKAMPEFAKVGDSWSYGTHGFVATSYKLTTDQFGTQLDPPSHWNEFGATISDLPPTVAVRPLVVVNIEPKVAKNANYHATVEDVRDWEKAHGKVPEGSVVFFRSDWSKGWAQEAKHPRKTIPGVKLDTLKFLHHERKILFHGHEPLDTDTTPFLEGEAWLMHNDFAQAEGLTNLHLVPEFGCLVSIGFAKPLGGSGGYARYVAVCPHDSTSTGTTIAESPGAPLPRQAHPLRRSADGVLRPDKNAKPTEYCKVLGALGCDGHKRVWEE